MKSLISFVAVVASMSASSSLLAATDINLREQVTPRSSVVRLGDVAEVTSPERQAARQLAALPLMPAPASGTERFLRTREIQDMLSAQGVDMGDVRFSGADRVVVSATDATGPSAGGRSTSRPTLRPMNRHSAILAGATSDEPAHAGPLDETQAKELRDRLNGVIGNYINAKTGRITQWQINCDVEERQLAKFAVATSKAVCSGGSDPWTGRQRFLVSFSTADGPIQLPIMADVVPPPVPVVVAIRPIARGDVIKVADIELRTMDAPSKSSGGRGVVDSVEKLIGMEARQSIQAGDVMFADTVQAPIMVKRGEIVTVTSQSGGIRVRISARALHDGSHGELVQLESLGSKEKFDARVIGPREAAVFAASRPAGPEPQQPISTARR